MTKQLTVKPATAGSPAKAPPARPSLFRFAEVVRAPAALGSSQAVHGTD